MCATVPSALSTAGEAEVDPQGSQNGIFRCYSRARTAAIQVRGNQMSVQALSAERQIWIYTQMLRIREFEERVKRTFTEHPGVIRGHTHLADGAEEIGRAS